MSNARCEHQVKHQEVYLCKRTKDAVGMCKGMCGSYSPIDKAVHPSVCDKCHQPLSSVESLEKAEREIEELKGKIEELKAPMKETT